tara:strand:- start:8725 stop:8859 length:135 start_codon:yes stop_codon:yes gene_type:complete
VSAGHNTGNTVIKLIINHQNQKALAVSGNQKGSGKKQTNHDNID